MSNKVAPIEADQKPNPPKTLPDMSAEGDAAPVKAKDTPNVGGYADEDPLDSLKSILKVRMWFFNIIICIYKSYQLNQQSNK